MRLYPCRCGQRIEFLLLEELGALFVEQVVVAIDAVPEIGRIVMPFRSIRMPRENELGLAYAYASFNTL
jgi:hypothetical protein